MKALHSLKLILQIPTVGMALVLATLVAASLLTGGMAATEANRLAGFDISAEAVFEWAASAEGFLASGTGFDQVGTKFKAIPEKFAAERRFKTVYY